MSKADCVFSKIDEPGLTTSLYDSTVLASFHSPSGSNFGATTEVSCVELVRLLNTGSGGFTIIVAASCSTKLVYDRMSSDWMDVISEEMLAAMDSKVGLLSAACRQQSEMSVTITRGAFPDISSNGGLLSNTSFNLQSEKSWLARFSLNISQAAIANPYTSNFSDFAFNRSFRYSGGIWFERLNSNEFVETLKRCCF